MSPLKKIRTVFEEKVNEVTREIEKAKEAFHPEVNAKGGKDRKLKKVQEKAQTFSCPACDAPLIANPGSKTMLCEYCDQKKLIAHSPETLSKALDLTTFLKKNLDSLETYEQLILECRSCGAETALAEGEVSGRCAFCDNPLTGTGQACPSVKAQALLRFKISEEEALSVYRHWASHPMASSSLRSGLAFKTIHALFVPVWLFSGRSQTQYKGQKGQRRRTVAKEEEIDWTKVRGKLSYDLKNLSLSASPTLQAAAIPMTWDFSKLQPMRGEYLAGIRTEASKIGLTRAFEIARDKIKSHIEREIKDEIGGEMQIVDKMKIKLTGMGFRLVLLPLWIVHGQVGKAEHRLIINGWNGKRIPKHGPTALLWTLAFCLGLMLWLASIGLGASLNLPWLMALAALGGIVLIVMGVRGIDKKYSDWEDQ